MSFFVPLTNARLYYNIVDMLAAISPSLVLIFLFFMSTNFTESISAPKYPAYKAYQKRVAMFWPSDTVFKKCWLASCGDKRAAEELIWGEGVLGKDE